MLRRPPTAITLTGEDIDKFEEDSLLRIQSQAQAAHDESQRATTNSKPATNTQPDKPRSANDRVMVQLSGVMFHSFFILLCGALVTAHDKFISTGEAETLIARDTTPSTWWFANIPRNGAVAYQSKCDYVVFRNVQSYGAVGDGMTDDAAAINRAMFDGSRCMGQYNPTEPCESTTILPAIVYFPPGQYLISSRIILPYNTIAIGDALDMPTIIGMANFSDLALFDSNPYYDGGANWYINQNNFFRQVRNFKFDITRLPIGSGSCIHWQVAQACSLQNLIFNMVEGGGDSNKQQGIVMENGSGGFMRDLVLNGGGIGFFLG